MSVRRVLTYPDPLLKQVSKVVSRIDEDIKSALKDLEDTMYDSPGCVGIAAPQIGEMVRILIIDASRNRKPVANHGRLVLVNPEILSQEGQVLGREGCLSLPMFTANVLRAKNISVRALDESGESYTIDTADFEARVILHELDHLDGLLFLDRVSSLKTDVFRRKNL